MSTRLSVPSDAAPEEPKSEAESPVLPAPPAPAYPSPVIPSVTSRLLSPLFAELTRVPSFLPPGSISAPIKERAAGWNSIGGRAVPAAQVASGVSGGSEPARQGPMAGGVLPGQIPARMDDEDDRTAGKNALPPSRSRSAWRPPWRWCRWARPIWPSPVLLEGAKAKPEFFGSAAEILPWMVREKRPALFQRLAHHRRPGRRSDSASGWLVGSPRFARRGLILGHSRRGENLDRHRGPSLQFPASSIIRSNDPITSAGYVTFGDSSPDEQSNPETAKKISPRIESGAELQRLVALALMCSLPIARKPRKRPPEWPTIPRSARLFAATPSRSRCFCNPTRSPAPSRRSRP